MTAPDPAPPAATPTGPPEDGAAVVDDRRLDPPPPAAAQVAERNAADSESQRETAETVASISRLEESN